MLTIASSKDILQLKSVNLFIFVKAITALRNDYLHSQTLYDKEFFPA